MSWKFNKSENTLSQLTTVGATSHLYSQKPMMATELHALPSSLFTLSLQCKLPASLQNCFPEETVRGSFGYSLTLTAGETRDPLAPVLLHHFMPAEGPGLVSVFCFLARSDFSGFLRNSPDFTFTQCMAFHSDFNISTFCLNSTLHWLMALLKL